MTALKLMFSVGLILGAGALAAKSAAKDEALAIVKKAFALIKREGAAFARFIGEDVSDVPAGTSGSEIKQRSVTAAEKLKAWSHGREA